MNKSIGRPEVIKMLKANGYDRIHTLRKTWEQVNGINRRGWFIATLHGWQFLGETLADALEYLTLKVEDNDNEWLTQSEAEREYGLTDSTIRQYVKNHRDEMLAKGTIKQADGRTVLIKRSFVASKWGRKS